MDLKPANLLISESGRLKIADLGLCRVTARHGKRLYSHQVATRWYRAPELLYGAREYDEGVDLWAAGCIFAEMVNHSPIFPVLPDASPDAMDLIKKFLIYSSDKRISAKKALLHTYFFTAPLATPVSQMPLPRSEKRPPPATQDYVTDFPIHHVSDAIRDHLETLFAPALICSHIATSDSSSVLHTVRALGPTTPRPLHITCHSLHIYQPVSHNFHYSLSAFTSHLCSSIPVRPIYNIIASSHFNFHTLHCSTIPTLAVFQCDSASPNLPLRLQRYTKVSTLLNTPGVPSLTLPHASR
ncbi:putative cyclin-dependent kinase 20-like [Penaeus vannamei]|uniref:Cyclin-dependent kinase 20 n=1 Tax=Penaeus vannamei TaxID=6689 RepID=A0A3R7PRP1_PENVA|nr:putative cyclin-dependent kinase 20-like [Penaeus vannamei]